jgi:hypothetical protein
MAVNEDNDDMDDIEDEIDDDIDSLLKLIESDNQKKVPNSLDARRKIEALMDKRRLSVQISDYLELD